MFEVLQLQHFFFSQAFLALNWLAPRTYMVFRYGCLFLLLHTHNLSLVSIDLMRIRVCEAFILCDCCLFVLSNCLLIVYSLVHLFVVVFLNSKFLSLPLYHEKSEFHSFQCLFSFSIFLLFKALPKLNWTLYKWVWKLFNEPFHRVFLQINDIKKFKPLVQHN